MCMISHARLDVERKWARNKIEAKFFSVLHIYFPILSRALYINSILKQLLLNLINWILIAIIEPICRRCILREMMNFKHFIGNLYFILNIAGWRNAIYRFLWRSHCLYKWNDLWIIFNLSIFCLIIPRSRLL